VKPKAEEKPKEEMKVEEKPKEEEKKSAGESKAVEVPGELGAEGEAKSGFPEAVDVTPAQVAAQQPSAFGSIA